jgi:hypothetical protein
MALTRERPATRGGVDRAEKISSPTNVFSSAPTVVALQASMLARHQAWPGLAVRADFLGDGA